MAQIETAEASKPTQTPVPPPPTATPVLSEYDAILQEAGATVHRGSLEVKKGDRVYYFDENLNVVRYRDIAKDGTRTLSASEIGIKCREDSKCTGKIEAYFKDKGYSLKKLE
jgi:hypothetical protein